jgi:dTDP-4-dehydrorhamnose reductase
MKVLVTGASGLLGSRVCEVFAARWEVTGTYHARPVPGLVECSLGSSNGVSRLVRQGGYGLVVHCAAVRSPDACEDDPRHAMEVNAHGTELIARAAADARAQMAYASTDYVFSGDAPPYNEQGRPAPINVYGHSKLAGEKHALAVPGALVVRMPALYSVDLSAPNNVLAALRESLAAGEPVRADDEAIRYYTLAEEVAAAFAFLISAGRRGVVHVSAPEPCTKLRFFRAVARVLGLDENLVVPAEGGRPRVKRPLDSHLDAALYESLDGPPLTPWSEALGRLASASTAGWTS